MAGLAEYLGYDPTQFSRNTMMYPSLLAKAIKTKLYDTTKRSSYANAPFPVQTSNVSPIKAKTPVVAPTVASAAPVVSAPVVSKEVPVVTPVKNDSSKNKDKSKDKKATVVPTSKVAEALGYTSPYAGEAMAGTRPAVDDAPYQIADANNFPIGHAVNQSIYGNQMNALENYNQYGQAPTPVAGDVPLAGANDYKNISDKNGNVGNGLFDPVAAGTNGWFSRGVKGIDESDVAYAERMKAPTDGMNLMSAIGTGTSALSGLYGMYNTFQNSRNQQNQFNQARDLELAAIRSSDANRSAMAAAFGSTYTPTLR